MALRIENILIADSVSGNSFTVKSCIHRLWPNVTVFEAISVNEVVERIFEQDFDLLILDINIAGNENIEEFISYAVKYTRVVIFSAYDSTDPKIKNLLQIGADAFLPKPVSEQELISILRFLFE